MAKTLASQARNGGSIPLARLTVPRIETQGRAVARGVTVPRIETQRLAVARGGRVLARGVSLRAQAGEVTALVGPSGIGKSSLLRCLVRLDEPAGGRVLVDGRDAAEMDPCVLRRRVGLVAQAPVMLAGDVRANLAYGLDEPRGLEEALESTGLGAEFMGRTARELSGGEAARVAVARALVRDPGALLLDEPTAALDSAAAAGIERLVRDLAGDGLAILIVTHDEPQAARVADRAVRLGDDGVEADGPVDEVVRA
jgi:putative ABC transport system ATP-binding protein